MFKAIKPIGYRPWAYPPGNGHSPLARLAVRLLRTEMWRPDTPEKVRLILRTRPLCYDITKSVVPPRLHSRLKTVRAQVDLPPDLPLDTSGLLAVFLRRHCVY